MTKHIDYDDYMQEYLKNDINALDYLDTALIEYEEDGDIEAFLLALRRVVNIKGGIGKLSEGTKLNRQNLYRVLNNKVDPQLSTLTRILNYLGFRLSVKVS